MLAEIQASSDRIRQMSNNEAQASHTVKLPPDHPSYRETVAVPIMQAVDSMPPPYRQAIHEFGYIDVYRAFRRGWQVTRIRDVAAQHGGRFVLPEGGAPSWVREMKRAAADWDRSRPAVASGVRPPASLLGD